MSEGESSKLLTAVMLLVAGLLSANPAASSSPTLLVGVGAYPGENRLEGPGLFDEGPAKKAILGALDQRPPVTKPGDEVFSFPSGNNTAFDQAFFATTGARMGTWTGDRAQTRPKQVNRSEHLQPTPTPVAVVPVRPDLVAWQSILRDIDPERLRCFLQSFPDSEFASLAQMILDDLELDLTPNPEPHRTLQPGQRPSKAGERLVETVAGVEHVFRYLPAGSFEMGSPPDEP
ncbi:MAG: hypothetical protein GY835_11605, partial [bacterium]|nr:hypothetical protein [bacterium]